MNEEDIVKIVLEELKERGLIRKSGHTAYSATESLLYNYNNLKQSIHQNELEIEDLRKYGLPKRSGSVLNLDKPQGGPTKMPELVVVDERVDILQQTNARTRALLTKIDRILNDCKIPRYPDLIKLLYFDEKSREEVAEFYQCDPTTVTRNKAKIVNSVKVQLFPNDTINDLGC